jgi:hypothetical protein
VSEPYTVTIVVTTFYSVPECGELPVLTFFSLKKSPQILEKAQDRDFINMNPIPPCPIEPVIGEIFNQSAFNEEVFSFHSRRANIR